MSKVEETNELCSGDGDDMGQSRTESPRFRIIPYPNPVI